MKLKDENETKMKNAFKKYTKCETTSFKKKRTHQNMYFHACKHIRYPNRNDTFLGKTKANTKIRSPFEDMSRSQGLSGPSFQRQAVSPPNGVHAFGGGILPSCFLSQKSTLFNSQRRIASFECRSSGSCVCTVFCLVFWLFDFWFGL